MTGLKTYGNDQITFYSYYDLTEREVRSILMEVGALYCISGEMLRDEGLDHIDKINEWIGQLVRSVTVSASERPADGMLQVLRPDRFYIRLDNVSLSGCLDREGHVSTWGLSLLRHATGDELSLYTADKPLSLGLSNICQQFFPGWR